MLGRSVGILVALAVAAGTLAACARETDRAPSPRPSTACGGFHLVVENAASVAVGVGLNGEDVARVEPAQTVEIVQFGNRPVPALPWDVEIRAIGDRRLLVAIRVVEDGTDGRRLRVIDPPPASPSLVAWTCGASPGAA